VTPSVLQVVYRVDGNASDVVITYIDERGRDQVLSNVPLPWELSMSVGPTADLSVDAYSDNETDNSIGCTISLNGTVAVVDRSDQSTEGVVCEKFAQ
jgi:hypothetical protein